ncbi:MAG: hypothetical protein PHR30_15335 [Gallionellaceae bacterium]|nr:hypothetical protein [Gallionellaceae bacterium]
MCASSTNQPDPADRIQTAKALYQSGHTQEAEQIFRDMVDRDHANGEAMGLLALIELQHGKLNKAKQLWKRSLRNPSPAWIFLSNLHNLLKVLLKEGAKPEAIRQAEMGVPAWPAIRVPNPEEKRMLLSLVDILTLLDQIDSAARLLESLVTCLPREAGLLYALGRLQMLKGDIASAWQTLSEADKALQPKLNFQLLSDLYHCADALNDQGAIRILSSRIAAELPVFASPARPTQKANILVLNQVHFVEAGSECDLHFFFNYPAQISRLLADEFHFSSVFADDPAGRAAAGKLPKPDLIINNISNGEALLADGTQAAITQFAGSFGVPVVNDASKAVLTTRDHSASLLADLPGVIIPATGRFSKTGKTTAELIDGIEATCDYPMITRTLDSQQGRGMTKVDDRDELIKALDSETREQFFITQFVDSRGTDGFYRKIRAAVVGERVIVMRVDYDTHWNVHGRKSAARVAFYRNNRHLLAQEDRICTDPGKELGAGVMPALQSIRERIPLDVFGVDFDVASDGRLVIYEANATMSLFSAAQPDISSPKHAHERTLAAVRDYLDGLLK